MKKIWLLFVFILIVLAQSTFLSSFHSIELNVYTQIGTSAIVISKAEYVYLRAEIDIYPQVIQGQSQVTVIFANGTQVKLLPSNAVSPYRISVVLPIRGYAFGISFGTTGEGVNVSDGHPVDAEVLSNATDFVIGQRHYDFVNVYELLIQGSAWVSIKGYGVAV